MFRRQSHREPRHVRRRASAFYRQIAIALSLFIIVGFFTHLLPAIPHRPAAADDAGASARLVFTAWLVLFVAQTRLVAAHRVDLHMKLGIAERDLAGIVVVVGVPSVSRPPSAHVSPSGLTPPQFTIVGLTIDRAVRGVPRAGHRLAPAAGAASAFHDAGDDCVAQPGDRAHRCGCSTCSWIVPSDSAVRRRCSSPGAWSTTGAGTAWCIPVYAIGGVAIIASWPLRLMIGRSEWYFPIGEQVARLAHSMFGS